MRLLLASLALIASLATIAAPAPRVLSAQSSSLQPQSVVRAFPNLTFKEPLFLTHAGDGTNRVFVAEHAGRVLVFPNDQAVSTADVFLDIRERVLLGHPELGFLGLAFDPNFVENGHFYVYYTAPGPQRSVISRFTVLTDNPNAADPASEMVILTQAQPFQNHNAGMIAFGPDGYLYAAFGDGGDDGTKRDPGSNGQNPGTLLSTIIRIDVRGATADQPYRVPEDNPFVGRPDARPEVWAYGFRNPWRFSFGPSGELWVGDVGQNAHEEIDLVKPGNNYGWSIMEGAHCFLDKPCDPTGLTPPVIEYVSYDEGCAIAGGYVYRGYRVSALRGAYVYGDLCSGRLFALRYDHQNETVTEYARLTDWWGDINISSFGEDEQGELYAVDFTGGGVYWLAANEPLPTPMPTTFATPEPLQTPALDATGTPAPTASPTQEPTSTATPSTAVQPGATTPPPTGPRGGFNAGLLIGVIVAGGIVVGGGSALFLLRRR